MLADKAAAASEEAAKLQLLLPENASTERDRLLLEFEERRKDLEAQQKQEQVAAPPRVCGLKLLVYEAQQKQEQVAAPPRVCGLKLLTYGALSY
jgi:hypothetical protein